MLGAMKKYTIDGSQYIVAHRSGGGLAIVRCESAEASIVVPCTFDSIPFVEIAQAAFSGLEHVLTIVCPDTVNIIGAGAFTRCSHLRRIVFPSAVTGFDASWLSHCPRVEDVVLPGSAEILRANRFRGVHPLRVLVGRGTKVLEIPAAWRDEVREFAVDRDNPWLATDGRALYSRDMTHLFAGVVSDTSYVVNPACRSIEAQAFFQDKTLHEIHLPQGLEAIGEGAFAECAKLGILSVPASVKHMGAHAVARSHLKLEPNNPWLFIDEAGVLYERDDDGSLTLVDADGVQSSTRSYRVLDGTIRINAYAFANCLSLETIELPSTLQSMGADVFRGCAKLRHVHAMLAPALEAKAAEEQTSELVVDYPASAQGLSALYCAFPTGAYDPARIVQRCDRVVSAYDTQIEQFSYMTNRLTKPLFLQDVSRDEFLTALNDKFDLACLSFAVSDYERGFDELSELGLLAGERLTHAIELVNSAHQVKATAYLLELKKRENAAAEDFAL